jgi:hypothetical protein
MIKQNLTKICWNVLVKDETTTGVIFYEDATFFVETEIHGSKCTRVIT